jgi:copper chaperone NosL
VIRLWKSLAAAALATALVTGCDEKTAVKTPPPQEVSDAAIGHFCGMALAEHPGPKGQIFVADRKEPYWFSSAREVFAFARLPEEPKAILAIYVNDMGKARDWDHPEAGTWIPAGTAWYVIASARKGGMSDAETIPFGEEARAREFAAANGGRVVRFDEMPEDYIFPGADAAPAPHEHGG